MEPALQDALRSLGRSGMSWQRAWAMVAAIEILEGLFQGCEKAYVAGFWVRFYGLSGFFKRFVKG